MDKTALLGVLRFTSLSGVYYPAACFPARDYPLHQQWKLRTADYPNLMLLRKPQNVL
jgi:hypothetical protein